jgi:hypothetical protein
MLSLNIEKEDIHRLNSKVFKKEYKVIAADKEFSFSIHQSLLLSASFTQRFFNGETSINIDLSNNKGITNDALLMALSDIYFQEIKMN